jgi:hypothetical protein
MPSIILVSLEITWKDNGKKDKFFVISGLVLLISGLPKTNVDEQSLQS